MYAQGEGVARDDAKAREWLLKAAGQAGEAAQEYFGLLRRLLQPPHAPEHLSRARKPMWFVRAQ